MRKKVLSLIMGHNDLCALETKLIIFLQCGLVHYLTFTSLFRQSLLGLVSVGDKCRKYIGLGTGKSLLEALILASNNPQYWFTSSAHESFKLRMLCT